MVKKLFILVVVAVVIGGCGRQNGIPVGRYILSVEDITSENGSATKKLTIKTQESCCIRLTYSGGSEEYTLERTPEEKDSVSEVVLTLRASLAKSYMKDTNIISLAVGLGPDQTGPVNVVGFPIPSDKSLAEVAQIDIKSGAYPVGRELDLGFVGYSRIVLEVGAKPKGSSDENEPPGVICRFDVNFGTEPLQEQLT